MRRMGDPHKVQGPDTTIKLLEVSWSDKMRMISDNVIGKNPTTAYA